VFKRIFIQGLVAAILSSLAAIIYNRIYHFVTEVDFSRILNNPSIAGLSFFACMIAVFVNYGLIRWLGRRGEIVFNFLFSVTSFACVTIPISLNLPLDIKNPELFPGLAVPMVFFPCVAWYTVRPLFS
jgi:hypothetical protein